MQLKKNVDQLGLQGEGILRVTGKHDHAWKGIIYFGLTKTEGRVITAFLSFTH